MLEPPNKRMPRTTRGIGLWTGAIRMRNTQRLLTWKYRECFQQTLEVGNSVDCMPPLVRGSLFTLIDVGIVSNSLYSAKCRYIWKPWWEGMGCPRRTQSPWLYMYWAWIWRKTKSGGSNQYFSSHGMLMNSECNAISPISNPPFTTSRHWGPHMD